MSTVTTRTTRLTRPSIVAAVIAVGAVAVILPALAGQGEWTWVAPLNECALDEVEVQPMSEGRDLYLSYWWLIDPGLGGEQVQKSDDFGASWTGVGPGASRPLDLAVTTDSQVLYLSSLDGLYRSQDGGASWLLVNAAHVHHMAVDPADPSTLVAGVGGFSSGSLGVSQDGGATWTITGPGGATSVAIDADDPACSPFCVYAGVQDGWLHRVLLSEDGGFTWQELWADPGYGLPLVAVDPHVQGAIWVAVRDGLDLGFGFFERWSRTAGFEYPVKKLPCALNDLGVPGGLAVDPLTASTVYVSCRSCDAGPPNPTYAVEGALFVTTDGGQGWELALGPMSSIFSNGGQVLSPVVVASGSGRTIHVPVVYGCLGQISFVDPDRLLSYTIDSQQSETIEDQTNPGSTPVTLGFDDLLVGGDSTLATSDSGPPPPAGFSLGEPPIYYDITTTAVFAGEVEVCIDYTGTSLERPGDLGEDTLALFHYEEGVWEDRTSSRNPAGNLICARVTSLSPFAVFTPDSDGDGVADGADRCPQTAIPESVPTVELGVNRWALVDSDPIFDTVTFDGGPAKRSFTTTDTAGCSCEQIIVELGLGKGHEKFGCSTSVMKGWIASQSATGASGLRPRRTGTRADDGWVPRPSPRRPRLDRPWKRSLDRPRAER